MNSTSLYAAIDLGSNSFHMLVVREAAGSIQTLTRIKRKVRLAAGLNNDNHLSAEAMERGWQCLRLFAERLQDIPQPQIRVVATATLRLAVNAGEFIAKAQTILGCPVQVISGEEEARLIYQGVAHTTGGADQRLVVDIGGASTELVTGTGAQTTSLFSLSMGCVTWLERYFSDRNLAQENFDDAEKAARDVLRPVADELRFHGWKVCVGASGTVQALQEIMMAQGMDERITLAKLQTRDTVRASGRAGNRRPDAGARAGFPKRAGYSDRDIYRAEHPEHDAGRRRVTRRAGVWDVASGGRSGYPQPHAAKHSASVYRRYRSGKSRGEAGR